MKTTIEFSCRTRGDGLILFMSDPQHPKKTLSIEPLGVEGSPVLVARGGERPVYHAEPDDHSFTLYDIQQLQDRYNRISEALKPLTYGLCPACNTPSVDRYCNERCREEWVTQGEHS